VTCLSVNNNTAIVFNTDNASNNYAIRGKIDNDNSYDHGSQPAVVLSPEAQDTSYTTMDITNIDGEIKQVFNCQSINTGGSGGANAPHRRFSIAKWGTTSGQITKITVTDNNGGTGSITCGVGSYITVLGTDGTATEPATTDEKTTLTNVPANTRYEETDTRKIYRRAEGNATVSTLNATNGTTNWSADTAKLTKSGNTITFSATGASNDEEIYYDLTSTSDDKWTLRFKADFTSIGAGANATHQQLQFGIYDSASPSGGNGSGDAIMFYLSSAGNVSNAVNGVNGGTSGITSTNNTPIASSGSAVTYYIELQRTSSSAIQAKVFSDEYDTQVGSTLSKTGLSGITGLRYLMVRLWSEGGAGNGAVGSVTDMKFYNNTTTPLNARWIERNTA